MLELRLLEPLQHHIVLQRKVQDQSVLMAVLRNMTHICAALADRAVRNILAAQGDLSRGLIQPRQTVDQLRLSVAVDTGDAHDLPGPDPKADMIHRVVFVGMGGHAQVFHSEDVLLRLGRLLGHLQLYRAAHHHVGKLLLIGLPGVHGTDVAALTQNGDPV